MEDSSLNEPEGKALVAAGQRAIQAAEARDEMGVFDVGADMYAVCTGCHATYAIETIRPGARIGGD